MPSSSLFTPRTLQLVYNNLTGTLSNSFGNMRLLKYAASGVGGVAGLCACVRPVLTTECLIPLSIRSLEMFGNRISGSIPSTVSGFNILTYGLTLRLCKHTRRLTCTRPLTDSCLPDFRDALCLQVVELGK
jgi:hypothetical protein